MVTYVIDSSYGKHENGWVRFYANGAYEASISVHRLVTKAFEGYENEFFTWIRKDKELRKEFWHAAMIARDQLIEEGFADKWLH